MYSAILSDAGDILFDTSPAGAAQKAAFETIFSKEGKEFPGMTAYKPYRILAQTEIDETEAISRFFSDSGLSSGYPEYSELKADFPSPELFEGVSLALREFGRMGIPFYILTNGPMREPELNASLGEMICSQLYGSLEKPASFDIREYVKGQFGSRDLGARKPDVRCYFESAARMGKDPSEILFISHELDELEGALIAGMGALALVGGRSDFASKDDSSLAGLSARYPGRVFSYEKFSEIPSSFASYST